MANLSKVEQKVESSIQRIRLENMKMDPKEAKRLKIRKYKQENLLRKNNMRRRCLIMIIHARFIRSFDVDALRKEYVARLFMNTTPFSISKSLISLKDDNQEPESTLNYASIEENDTCTSMEKDSQGSIMKESQATRAICRWFDILSFPYILSIYQCYYL